MCTGRCNNGDDDDIEPTHKTIPLLSNPCNLLVRGLVRGLRLGWIGVGVGEFQGGSVIKL